MNLTYKPDKRTIADILEEIREKSESYTPEWHFDLNDPDGGTALAQLYAEMLCGTIDRYNRYFDKCCLEFLNVLGVFAKSVSPAVGIAQAEPVDGINHNVFIKKGTQLFCDVSDNNGDHRIVFETDNGFYAVPAKITSLYLTNPLTDIITHIAVNGKFSETELFNPDPADNIERHCFCILNRNILTLKNPAEITLRFSSEIASRTEDYTMFLSNSEDAHWSFFDGQSYTNLHTERVGNDIILTKEIMSDALPDGESEAMLLCEINGSGLDEIVVKNILLNVRSLPDESSGKSMLPDRMFGNNEELPVNLGGYCFGKELMPYESFLICCNEAFCKCGSEITIELYIGTVIIHNDAMPEEPIIEFNQKMIIEKVDTKPKPLDDIYISEVVWEYWNGSGWAFLHVRGDVNPFSCQGSGGKKLLCFKCPYDIADSTQNAYSGLWIRARVKEIENQFSMHSRTLVPLIKSIDISYDYGDRFLLAEKVISNNSLKKCEYIPQKAEMAMTLFKRFPERCHAVYFLFDKPPVGYPANFYFEFAGNTAEERMISFEYLSEGDFGKEWHVLKVIDKTNGFENSGIISMYAAESFVETELFGEKGFWIRAVNQSMRFKPNPVNFPKLTQIIVNAVEITQKESVKNELRSIKAGKADERVQLQNKPIIDCELWVNELPETPLSELTEYEENHPENVRKIFDENGQLSKLWIKWLPKAALSKSEANDRHFCPDYMTGEILFGNGVNGRIASYRLDAEISIDYSFGGGSAGNFSAGTIGGSIESIPFINSFTNVFPTCGGSDGQSLETIRNIGTKRLKHRGRAVTAEDFETLISEEFCEVSEVKCFANYDRNGKKCYGCATVVIKPFDYENRAYAAALSGKVEEFVYSATSCVLTASKGLCVIAVSPVYISSEITVMPDDYEYAAEIESRILEEISNYLSDKRARKIGVIPQRSDIISLVKKIPHVAYVSKVILMGEFYRENKKITVLPDELTDYKYLAAANGRHTVKI